MKQEIAKEGILPFRKFIAQGIKIPRNPLRKLFRRSPSPNYDEIPAGALFVHWAVTVLLILATGAQRNAYASYAVLVSIYGYSIDAFFGAVIGSGLLFLRITRRRKWGQKSGINPYVSSAAAFLFTIANLFPIVTAWVRPSGSAAPATGNDVPWFTTPTVGWALIASGILYWVGFYFLVPKTRKHDGKGLQVHRKLFFHEEHGYPVQWHEQLSFQWIINNMSEHPSNHAEEQIEVRGLE